MRKRSSVIWYKGFGNTFTIISFLTLLWPLSVVVMWLFSDWSKAVKKIITFTVYFPFSAFYLGRFFSSPGRLDMQKYQSAANLIVVYLPLLLLVLILIFLLTQILKAGLIAKYRIYVFVLVLFLISLWVFSLGFLINPIY